jgi:hypothetical protein
MQPPKAQLNVRLNHACMELIKLERRNIPGCASDGEALESIIFRSATSPEARQIIKRAAAKEPLFAAATLALEMDHSAGISFPTPPPPTGSETHPDGPKPGDQPGDLARRYAAGLAKTPTAPPNAAPASSAPHSRSKKSQTQ